MPILTNIKQKKKPQKQKIDITDVTIKSNLFLCKVSYLMIKVIQTF